MKALQKREHELRGIRAIGGKLEQHNAHDHAHENLEVDFLFCGKSEVVLLRDFRVVIDETDCGETNQRKERKQDEWIGQVRPKKDGHSGRNNNEHAAHRRSSRLFLMLLWTFF